MFVMINEKQKQLKHLTAHAPNTLLPEKLKWTIKDSPLKPVSSYLGHKGKVYFYRTGLNGNLT